MKEHPSSGYVELNLRFNGTTWTDPINLTKYLPNHYKPGIFPVSSLV